MSVLLIEEVGPATSVQDLGRFGAIRYGLGTAGAMDRFGLACANVLVGQPWDAPAIEVGPLPMRLKVKEGSVRLATVDGIEWRAGSDARKLLPCGGRSAGYAGGKGRRIQLSGD